MQNKRRHLFIQLSERRSLKIISDSEYTGKQFYCTLKLNEDQVFGVWSIVEGSQYASINSNGKVTINEGVTNQQIKIQCIYQGDTVQKIITISYDNQLTVESPDEISGTSATLLARYNSTVVSANWELLSGSAYATLSSDGNLTILDTGYINVRATYSTYSASKQIKVTYVANTTTTVEVGEDGSVTTETTTTTTDPETGVTTEQTSTQTVNEDGSSSTTTVETTTNQDGSSSSSSTTTNSDGTSSETQTTVSAPDSETGAVTSESTTVNYDDNGNATGSSENTTVENTDGSSSSSTTNYNANGDPTDQQNVDTDTTGNINTQDVVYDENGNSTVTGYTIDTSASEGTGKEIEGDGIDTEFIPFDDSGLGFICHMVFETVGTEQPIPPIVADTEDTSTNYLYNIMSAKTTTKVNGGWPGFDIRWSVKKSDGTPVALQLRYTETGKTGSTTVNLTGKSLDGTTSGNYYDVTIIYDPNLYLEGNTYKFKATSGNNCMQRTVQTNVTFDANNIDFTIGYAINMQGQAYRHANVTIHEFSVTKINPPNIIPEDPVITTENNTVTITCVTSGASIYYRLNQTGNYQLYSNPIQINADTVVQAYSMFGSNQSTNTVSAVCEYDDGLVNPVITCNGQLVTISCETPAVDLYYRFGTSGSWEEYQGPISINETVTVQAYADLNGHESEVVTQNCVYNPVEAPVITTENNTVTITCSTPSAAIYYRIGVNGEFSVYNAAIIINETTVVQAYAELNGENSATITEMCEYVSPVHDYSQDYLTFNVLANGTIVWKSIGSGYAKTIQYSINDGTWTSITATTAGEAISVSAGDVVRFKGSNTRYAKDKSNYSGFEGGTATYNIEGNIMSLTNGDNFAEVTTLPDDYLFCSIFKLSNAISAENLILPALRLTTGCYRAMFSKATSLIIAPALPATTLAQNCYWYMFENCAIETAPVLEATALVKECYGYMFTGCHSLNYIKCLATTNVGSNDSLKGWVTSVASTGTFIKAVNISWSSGNNGIPSGWTAYDVEHEPQPEIEVPDWDISDAPLLRGWKYSGNDIELPYSINAIDGHSSSYAKGSFTFTSDIILDTVQPTYLWFHHADQAADIYIDNTFVTTHWGGYNSFFVDITNFIHVGKNDLKVIISNNKGNYLAPAAGDFNFNATLSYVELWTSPVLPSTNYGYDGFHVTTEFNADHTEATLKIRTSVPDTATVVLTIDDTQHNGSYHYTTSTTATGDITFTHAISGNDLHLWNGTLDPHLYDITLEFYYNNVKYHTFTRPYGIRYYDYVINEEVNGSTYTGFLLNGQPYLLRGVCMHSDKVNKANALTRQDIADDFALIQDLGCNFIRTAHYPHPKEVYDWCDRLGIIVQTEVPCVNKLQSTMPTDYYDHLTSQYTDMVNEHYNHPSIMFWGLSNETTTDDKAFGHDKIEAYTALIHALDPERWVGFVMSHSTDNPSAYYNHPDVDWFGCNLYVGWYIDKTSNNPTNRLNTRCTNIITNRHKALAYSEYGCGGTQTCHSDDFMTTTTSGNNPRHDIEYQMWLHEGHIAAIKNFPQLLFTAEWQLFDIAVYNRVEGYIECLDGETTSENAELKRLNNKGLVQRDHVTKKDPYYLYKAWWNPNSKFIHICCKEYTKNVDRVIKCYTNETADASLYVNGVFVETVSVSNYIASFTATTFSSGDVVRVDCGNSSDTFTFA